MSLDPEDSIYFSRKMTEQLLDMEEELNNFTIKISEKEKERNEERQLQTLEIQNEARKAFKSTQIMRSHLDDEYTFTRKRREKEMVLRAAEERQKAADRELDWEKYQAREIKSSELRQQYLERDSHRDKLERQDKVDKFKDLLDHKTTYDNSLTHNRMMLMDKYKTNRLQIADSETRKFKASEDANRAALMAADAQKSSNEELLKQLDSLSSKMQRQLSNLTIVVVEVEKKSNEKPYCHRKLYDTVRELVSGIFRKASNDIESFDLIIDKQWKELANLQKENDILRSKMVIADIEAAKNYQRLAETKKENEKLKVQLDCYKNNFELDRQSVEGFQITRL